MMKDAGGKLDNYSITPKIRQILLHWGYKFWGFCSYKNESLLVQQTEIIRKKKKNKQKENTAEIDTKT